MITTLNIQIEHTSKATDKEICAKIGEVLKGYYFFSDDVEEVKIAVSGSDYKIVKPE